MLLEPTHFHQTETAMKVILLIVLLGVLLLHAHFSSKPSAPRIEAH